MDLVIGNKIIVTPMMQILHQLQKELKKINGKLADIEIKNNRNISITCPNSEHKGGFESHPSCQVFADPNDENIEYGTVHCFTCGFKCTLPQMIGYCFDEDEQFGKEWLLLRCETAFVTEVKFLPEIVLKPKREEVSAMQDCDLNKYKYYHNYMWQRKLSPEVVDKFEVGYDPTTNMLIFPVRDEKGILRFVTGRSVTSHYFMIPDDVKKPVYLLYYMKQHNIKRVGICESQINALYLNSLGKYSVALFGTGTPEQYDALNKSGIRVFDLYFDGDAAGRKAIQRFKQNIRDDVIINTYILPEGKDVNDLSLQEINTLPMI